MEELPKENNAMINEISTWEDLDMKTELLRGVYANGFEKPSQIQKKAIRPIFDKKDVDFLSSDLLLRKHSFIFSLP
jgi:ATP-dependent RNA helicase